MTARVKITILLLLLNLSFFSWRDLIIWSQLYAVCLKNVFLYMRLMKTTRSHWLCLTVLVYVLKSEKSFYLSKETEFLKHECRVRCNQIQGTINKAKKERELLKMFRRHIYGNQSFKWKLKGKTTCIKGRGTISSYWMKQSRNKWRWKKDKRYFYFKKGYNFECRFLHGTSEFFSTVIPMQSN